MKIDSNFYELAEMMDEEKCTQCVNLNAGLYSKVASKIINFTTAAY